MNPALATASLGIALSLSPQLAAQQQTQINPVKITDSVYMLMGRGGNIGLGVGEDGAFLIDDQYANMVPAILGAVADLTEQPVRFLVNTHYHGDHTGGNELIGEAGAIIVAHENVRRRMNAPQFSEALARNTPASPGAALPVVTFNDTVTFHWNGDEVRVFHVDPGHTDGDSIIHFVEANVFHMGDTFNRSGYPFVDLDSGGNFDGILVAAKQVLAMADEDTKIIPGHGPLSTVADLQTYVEVLTTIRGRFVELIEQGKTEDEVVEANPTREWDATWGQGFMNPETWTRILYKSLSRD